MDNLKKLHAAVPAVGVGENSRNWFSDKEEYFQVRLFESSNPADNKPGLSTDLFFADQGGRQAYVDTTRAQNEALDAADARVKAATEAGTPPDPADTALIAAAEDQSPVSVETVEQLVSEVPDDPEQFVWVNPWKNVAPAEAKTQLAATGIDPRKAAALKVGVYGIFGREGRVPKVPGLCVCEVSMLDVVKKRPDGSTYVDKAGVFIERFRIDLAIDATGGFLMEREIKPFLVRDIMYDYMLSFARKNDDRHRKLMLEFYIPDETTSEWKPFYNTVFSVDYRFTTVQIETTFRAENVPLPGSTPEQELLLRDSKLKQLQAKLVAQEAVAIFSLSPFRDDRFLSPVTTPLELMRERAVWLFNDPNRHFGGQRGTVRQREDDENNEDLVDDIQQQMQAQIAPPGPPPGAPGPSSAGDLPR